MKEFFNDLFVFILSMAAIICLYFAITVPFASALFNFMLFFTSIFLIIQTADIVDKNNNFGKYNQNKIKKNKNIKS